MESLRSAAPIALFALCACGRIGFENVPSQAVDAGTTGPVDAALVDAGTSLLIPECDWLVDTSPDFSTAVPVQGQAIAGSAFFSLRCAGNISKANLWFEDGIFRRPPTNQHLTAPYHLAKSSGEPAAIHVELLLSGDHSVGAWLDFDLEGPAAKIIRAPFTIANTGPPTLVVSNSPTRENPVPLAGQTLSGTVYISLQPGARAVGEFGPVEFFIDSTLEQTENVLPFDLAGGSNLFGSPDGFDLSTLGTGSHTIEAIAETASGTPETISATFEVN